MKDDIGIGQDLGEPGVGGIGGQVENGVVASGYHGVSRLPINPCHLITSADQFIDEAAADESRGT